MAFHSAADISPVSSYTRDSGMLRAYTYVFVTDINGNTLRKRVSLGNDYNSSLEAAREVMQRTRANNKDTEVCGDFKISL